jgi:hypothetical protein
MQVYIDWSMGSIDKRWGWIKSRDRFEIVYLHLERVLEDKYTIIFICVHSNSFIKEDWWPFSVVGFLWKDESGVKNSDTFLLLMLLQDRILLHLITVTVNKSLRGNCENAQWCCPDWTWTSVLMSFRSVTLINQWMSCSASVSHPTGFSEHPWWIMGLLYYLGIGTYHWGKNWRPQELVGCSLIAD